MPVRSWGCGSRVCTLLSMSPFLVFYLDVCAPFGSINADAPLSSGGYWLAMDYIFTSSDSFDFNEHNIGNPVLELLFHVQVGAFMEAHVAEVDFLVNLV